MSSLSFSSSVASALKGAEVVVFLAPSKFFRGGWAAKAVDAKWVSALDPMTKEPKSGPNGSVTSTLTGADQPGRAFVAILPESVSRHNTPSRSDAAGALVSKCGLDGKKAAIIVGLEEESHYLPIANAIGRVLPKFTRKGGKKETVGDFRIVGLDVAGNVVSPDKWIEEVVSNARWAAEKIDTPTAELSTADFVAETKRLLRGIAKVRIKEIVGDKLLEEGLGGLHAVGRAAVVPPRLMILEYTPAKPRRTIGLIGKGIVYDTGGLSLKATASMISMKGDMGGGAACVGAFRTLAKNGCKDRVICAVPLAENAMGPKSYRNDDILVMHSKKTVEINNTDAEGRLLLGDALSWVCRKYSPAVVMNAATLTGAQLVTSGWRHASVVSNREGLEQLAIRIGRSTGDLTHALLFAPEFFMSEFDSKFADMCNSVKDRSNAQSSCAAQFVYSHIEDLNVPWLHIDLAGPSWRDGRGTGYGVALMSAIAAEVSDRDLKA